jgi:hypothetical protein
LFLKGGILSHRREKYTVKPLAGHTQGAQAGDNFLRHTQPVTDRPIFQSLGKGK